MNKLITHIAEADVSAEFKSSAAEWPLWDSVTHPQKPKKSGKFNFDYNGEYATERVLIVTGCATVTPKDKSCGPITLSAGDAVHFHHGFSCAWHVTKPMTKRYAYFNADGEIDNPAQIACDGCGAECVEQSWFCNDEDICPACFEAAGGDTGKYAGAEYQEQGEAATQKKRAVLGGADEDSGNGKKAKKEL